METPAEYVERYYQLYGAGGVDEEMRITGSFLIEHTRGRVLDCGSGPVPQLWVMFMPHADEVYAVDLPQESTDFVENKLAHVEEWIGNFIQYQGIVEQRIGKQPESYLRNQVQKLRSMQRADMSASLPFPDAHFDTAVSLYSLGCLKNIDELEHAIDNLSRILKPGGKLLHVNTDGKNRNDILPAYTWNGMDQSSDDIVRFLSIRGYTEIEISNHPLPKEADSMYQYGAISTLLATKPTI